MFTLLLSFFVEPDIPISTQYEVPLIVEEYIPSGIPLGPLYTPVSVVEEEVEEIPCTGNYCSCMVFLQIEKNLALHGDAIDQIPNKPLEDVEVGDVILINYGGVGHAVYVAHDFPKAWWIEEANYREGEYTERALMKNDPRIRGAMKVHERVLVTIDK